MTLNISINAEDLSLWAMVKFLARLTVAAIPAYLLWVFVQSLIIPIWLMGFQRMVSDLSQVFTRH